MPGHLQHDGVDPGLQRYAKKVLEPKMDQAVAEADPGHGGAGKTEQPRYMELLIPNWYEQHILRRPAAQWPEPVASRRRRT